MVRIALITLLLAAPAAAAPVFGVRTDLPAPINPGDVAIADVNADGASDLVLVSPGSPPSQGQVTVWYGRGDGYFWPGPISTCLRSPRGAVVGDVNGDAYPDLALAGLITDSPIIGTLQGVQVLLGQGDGSFVPSTDISKVQHAFRAVAIADFDEDGHSDLAVAHSNSSQGNEEDYAAVYVYRGLGDGTYQEPLRLGVYPSWSSDLVAGDLDGNGTTDLALATNNGQASNLLQVPLHSWASDPGPAYADVIVLGRFDSDALPDVAYAYPTKLTIRASTAPGAPSDIALANVSRALVASDVDGDGTDDLLTTMDLPPVIELRLGHGDGTFDPATSYAAGSRPTSIAAGDLNGDGLTDLVVSNNGSASVTVLLQGNPVIGAANGPSSFGLAAAFPNPSRGTVTFGFELPSDEAGIITVHDVRGRLVESRTIQGGGRSVRMFENARPAAGIYWATLTQGARVASQRFVVLP